MPNKREDRFNPSDLIKIGEKLSDRQMKVLAVIHLGLGRVQIDQIWRQHGSSIVLFNKDVLRTWSYKDTANGKKVCNH